jgi:hypothetical protein
MEKARDGDMSAAAPLRLVTERLIIGNEVKHGIQ